jgi:hypothetical protein
LFSKFDAKIQQIFEIHKACTNFKFILLRFGTCQNERSMYQKWERNMLNWYMVGVGMFGRHVPKWEKKHGKLVHACNKSKEGEKK